MSSRSLFLALAIASAFSLSASPGTAVGAFGSTDLSSETASGEPTELVVTDAAAEAAAAAEARKQKEILTCYRDADGVKYEEYSQQQLECLVDLLAGMEDSAKALDHYNKYFREFLESMLESTDAGDHDRADGMIKSLLAAIDGKEFTSIEKSLATLGNKSKYLAQKDKLLEQRLAIDVINDPDAESKLAEINRKEVLLDGQYNGVLVDTSVSAGAEPGAKAEVPQTLEDLDANIAEAQKLWDMYHGNTVGYQRGGLPAADGQLAQKAESLITEDGFGLPQVPAMPAEGQGYGASIPMVDSSPN